jgi:alkanesulfonate monooxygenase SsuD/methylene tetrahydromethanopterin reductase-like flavin-dependent oxidoreductase (luciferase family)
MVSSQSYRNPALLAKIAAGVDTMSGGRLDFGIGAGWKDFEYRAYGYDFPDAGVRLAQLVDTLEICTRIWSDERATYEGKHYRVENALCSPKPIQQPLPIWVGGVKPRVMRIAARYGRWFNMSNPSRPASERLAEMKLLDDACRRLGRDPKTLGRSMFLLVLTAPTRREVDELVNERARGEPPAEWLASRPGLIAGVADEVASRLRELAAAGIGHVNIQFPYPHEIAAIRALRDVARAL